MSLVLCPSCSKSLDLSSDVCPHCQAPLELSTEKLGDAPTWGWPAGASAPAPLSPKSAQSTPQENQGWLGEVDPEEPPTEPLEDIWAKKDDEEGENTHKILPIWMCLEVSFQSAAAIPEKRIRGWWLLLIAAMAVL